MTNTSCPSNGCLNRATISRHGKEKSLAKLEFTLALAFAPAQVKFGYAKSDTLPRYCRACPYLSDCWGECPKNRLIQTPDGEPGLNYLCAGLKKFYKHTLPEVERIVAGIRQQQTSPGAFVRNAKSHRGKATLI